MRSREEVLTEYNIERDEEDGCLILPQHRDTIINALADRIRELESPPRPEPVAWATEDYDRVLAELQGVLHCAAGEGIVPSFDLLRAVGAIIEQRTSAHPSAAAVTVTEAAAKYIAAIDRVAEAKTAREIAQTARGIVNKGDGIAAAHRALAAATDERDTALDALRATLTAAPVVPVVAEADENGDVWMSVSVGPVTVDEAIACLRRHGWAIDTAALTAASEATGGRDNA